jgi:hypothetical protein
MANAVLALKALTQEAANAHHARLNADHVPMKHFVLRVPAITSWNKIIASMFAH